MADRPFTLFWAITRTQDKETANLVLEYPEIEVKATVVLPGKKRKLAVEMSEKRLQDLRPPVLTNPSSVKAHVRLFALDDLNLQKIRQRETERATAFAEAAKRKKAEEKEAASSSKR